MAPPPGFSHTLSSTSRISKIPILVVNSGYIVFGPPLKNFLPTPLLIISDFAALSQEYCKFAFKAL